MVVTKTKALLRLLRFWQLRLQRTFKQFGLPDYTLFSIFSIITGAAAGFAAVFFKETIHFFSRIFLEELPRARPDYQTLIIILIPGIGMLIQSGMIALAPQTSRQRGVLEVIKSVALRGGYISFRTTLFHFLAPAICIGTGGTVGPEGPAAQIGAGVSSKMARLFGLSEPRRRMFTAAGAGAAIAAVFNTPLGGIFFALEIILLNDFQTATFSSLILASVTASAISHVFLGNQPAFIFSDLDIGSYETFLWYALLGLGAGVLSLLYIQYVEKVGKALRRRPLNLLPGWLIMLGIGVLLGVCGLFYPDILGIGYAAINKMLAAALPWKIVALLLLLKFLFVPLILESGGFGGTFAPSLFLGAGYGYLFATGLNHAFGLQLNTTAFTLVGMGAVLGGVNSIPISSILIIFEMTREYSFILPLMLGVVTSTTLTHLVVKGSIHTRHLEAQGFRISGGTEKNILRALTVRNVMRKDAVTVPETTPLPELIQQCIESPHETIFTMDAQNRLTGVITSSELRPMITEYEHLREMLIASDIAREEVLTVKKDDDLEHVLSLFGGNIDILPVVDPADSRAVIGTVRRQDVINAYHRESLKYNIAAGFAHSLRTLEQMHAVAVADGYAAVERPVPEKFIGKSLSRLRLRNRYGVEVLMIKRSLSEFTGSAEAQMSSAAPNTVLQRGDVLLLFGKDEHIRATETWGR